MSAHRRVNVARTWRVYGIPEPELEHRFHPVRRWRFDYAWPDLRIALELEGGVWTRGRHTRGSGFVADLEKYNEAALGGWLLLRVTPRQLWSDAPALVLRAINHRRGAGC